MISIQVDGIEYRFFDHLYAVSRCGKALRKLQPYTPTVHNKGYLVLGRQRLMHRVVAACWLESFDPLKQVHTSTATRLTTALTTLNALLPRSIWQTATPKQTVGIAYLSKREKRFVKRGWVALRPRRRKPNNGLLCWAASAPTLSEPRTVTNPNKRVASPTIATLGAACLGLSTAPLRKQLWLLAFIDLRLEKDVFLRAFPTLES